MHELRPPPPALKSPLCPYPDTYNPHPKSEIHPTWREATKPLYLRASRSMYAGSFVLSLLVASTCAI